MKTTIENYRGIEIWFDTNNESFQCDIDDSRSIKKSYSAIKKFIDDWKKDNANFKSFNIESNPLRSYGGQKWIRVVGIRKDGRFVLEDANGNKSQLLSDYQEDDYILPNPENKFLLMELEKIKIDRVRLNEEEKAIKSKLKITTVKDIKKNYL